MIRHFMFQIDKDDSIGGTRLDKELFNVSDISYLRYINWAKLFLGSVLPLYLTLSGVCPVSGVCNEKISPALSKPLPSSCSYTMCTKVGLLCTCTPA
jgi:hypothetical protein